MEFSVQHRSRQNNRQDKAPTQKLTDGEPSRRNQNRSRGQKAEVVSRENDKQDCPRQAESVTECQSANKRSNVSHRGWQRTIWQRVSVRLGLKFMPDWCK
ncbi:hypothetical protein LDENG_00229780 [Lucifuga dentata]|nr:hypothetical protein LDENG_00229780 [Lucifuga dentata]